MSGYCACGCQDACPNRKRNSYKRSIRRAAFLLSLVCAVVTSGEQRTYSAASFDASPRIGALRRAVSSGDSGAVNRFWEQIRTGGAPLVEPIPGDLDSSLVTFVWHGTGETHNVVIFDGVAGFDAKDQMTRLEDTNVWYETYKIRSDARFAYNLSPNDSLEPFANIKGEAAMANRLAMLQTDPLNPRHCPATFGALTAEASYVELPNAPPQPWNAPVSQGTKGKLESTTFRSEILKNTRKVWVYTPAGFSLSERSYPLLLVFDGDRNVKWIPAILDNLIANGKIRPTVAVLIDNPTPTARTTELPCYPSFADFLVKEVLPWMRKNYAVTNDASRTVVAGSSYGGLAAMFAALKHPQAFGKVLCLSGSFWWKPESEKQPDWLATHFAMSPKLPLNFYLEVGLMEDQSMQIVPNRHMRDVLTAKGYLLHYGEYDGGHAFLNWSGGMANGLIFFLGSQHASTL